RGQPIGSTTSGLCTTCSRTWHPRSGSEGRHERRGTPGRSHLARGPRRHRRGGAYAGRGGAGGAACGGLAAGGRGPRGGGEGLQEASESALARGNQRALERLLVKFGQPGQNLAFYDRVGAVQAVTPRFRPLVAQAQPEVTAALASKETRRGLTRLGGRPAY